MCLNFPRKIITNLHGPVHVGVAGMPAQSNGGLCWQIFAWVTQFFFNLSADLFAGWNGQGDTKRDFELVHYM